MEPEKRFRSKLLKASGALKRIPEGPIRGLVLTELPVYSEPVEFLQRLAAMLRTLWQAFPRVTIDVRLWVRPQPGRVQVAVLTRHAPFESVQELFQTYLDGYSFSLMEASGIREWLEPFSMHYCAVLRRQARPWAAGTPIGFRNGSPGDRLPVCPSVFLGFRRLDTHALLQCLLQQGKHPLLVSVRIRPSALGPEEVHYLERLEARCLDLLDPERHQAGLCIHGWHRMLREAAALGLITLASPHRPNPRTLRLLQALLVGTDASNPWEWVQPAARQRKRLLEAMKRLDMPLPPIPGLDKTLQPLFYRLTPPEAATLVPLPLPSGHRVPGLRVRFFRDVPCSDDLSGDVPTGISGRRPVDLLPEAYRRQHVYIVGRTGTGKTTLLLTLALRDIRAGHGVCILDPHGDLFQDILARIPKERVDDVIVVDPSDTDYPVGFNLLEWRTPEERHFVAQAIVEIFLRLMEDEFGTSAGNFAGPIFQQHALMNLLLVMSDPRQPGTLLQFYQIFQQPGFWKRWLPLAATDPLLRTWVKRVLPHRDYLLVGSDNVSMGEWVSSKFFRIVFDPQLRLIFGQRRSTIDLRQAMNEGRIVLVNLGGGHLGIPAARFFGMVFLAKLHSVTMERVRVPQDQRRPFYVYVDEFQSMATQALVPLFSEGRKFGVFLTVANQFMDQIANERIVRGILGNVGTLVAFRVSLDDARRLEQEFWPSFRAADLLYLPNWTACVKTLRDRPLQPFTMKVLPVSQAGCAAVAEEVRQASRRRYGRPRDEVEAEIAESLSLPPETELEDEA